MIGRSGGIVAKRLGYTKRDIKSINITIGLNLAAARRNAGMTQTDVMQAVWGVSNNRNTNRSIKVKSFLPFSISLIRPIGISKPIWPIIGLYMWPIY